MKSSVTPTKKPRIAPHRIKTGRLKGTVRFSPIRDGDGIDMVITIQLSGNDAKLIKTADPAVLGAIIHAIEIITEE